MKREDCKHVTEFDLTGFKGSEIDFTNWIQFLLPTINKISNNIHNESHMGGANTVMMNEKTSHILILAMTKSNRYFDITKNEKIYGRYDLIVDDSCEDDTIFVYFNQKENEKLFMPIFGEDRASDGSIMTKTISFKLKNEFPPEEVSAFEKSLRGYIKIKNNFIHES